MMRIRFLLLYFTLVLGLAQSVQAQSLENMKKQHDAVLAQISKTEKELESNKNTVSNILYRYNALSDKIKESEKYLSEITVLFKKTTRELETLNAEYAQLNTQLNSCKDDYANMVRQIYLHLKDRSKLAFIFSADDFNQCLRRIRYLNDYARYEKKKAEEIREKQQDLDDLRVQLETKKKQQSELVTAQTEERDKLKSERAKQSKLLKQMRSKNSQLTAELKKQRQKAARLNNMIEKFIAEENKKSAERKDGERKSATAGGYAMTEEERKLAEEFGKNRGELSFPLNEHGFIVVHFGQNKHSDMKYVQNNSNGIDIKTQPGASAKAVFKGTVSKIFTMQGSNCSIILRHGNYYTVYSNLADVCVKTGQVVRTGDELGHVYVDKVQDNKTILHFQVYMDREKLDPESWIKKM